jgi:hypothetical protein
LGRQTISRQNREIFMMASPQGMMKKTASNHRLTANATEGFAFSVLRRTPATDVTDACDE